MNRGRNTVRRYSEKTIPAAESSLAAAIVAYTAGTIDFLRLVAAHRDLIDLQEKYQEALVDNHRRKAELRRAIGGLDVSLADSSERPNMDKE